MATAELTVTANLAGLRQQLETIPGITAEQAKLMVAELNKSLKASETAAKRAAGETKRAMQDTQRAAEKASAATADVGDKFGKVGSSAGKVAGVLDLLVPGLGGAARGVADVADGMEVAAQGGDKLAIGLGVVGAAMGAVALATQYYAEQLAAVEAANAKAAQAATEAVARTKALKDVEEELALQTAIATGAITEEEGAIISRTAAVRGAYDAQRQYLEAQVASTKAALSADGATTDAYGTYLDAEKALAAFTEREGEAVARAQELEQAKIREASAQRASARAREKAAEAAKRLAEEEAKFEAASSARSDLGKLTLDYAAGLEKLTAAQAVGLTEEQKAIAAGKERLAQLDDLALRTRYLALSTEEEARVDAEAAQARVAIRQDVQAQIDAIEAAASEKRQALRDEDLAAEASAAEERAALLTDALEQGFDTVRGLLEEGAAASADKVAALQQQLEQGAESLSQAEREALKDRVEAQRAAAIRAFEVAKAGKLAEAIINTATAVTANLANPVAAGIVAAIGAAQVATISAEQPAFHSGGMVGGPDQVGARLVAGEGVLSRQGVSSIGGPEAVRAANAGVSQAPVVVAVNQYRHEVFRPFIRDHLRLGGGLADAIRGQRTIGMREAL